MKLRSPINGGFFPGARLFTVALLAFVAWGCCPGCPEPCADCPGPGADPTATLVTIDANRVTSPPDDEITISQTAGGIQWYNDSDGMVKIALIGSPLSFELASKAYSNTHRLTVNASTGASISYTIDPPSTEAPDPPSFGVGP